MTPDTYLCIALTCVHSAHGSSMTPDTYLCCALTSGLCKPSVWPLYDHLICYPPDLRWLVCELWPFWDSDPIHCTMLKHLTIVISDSSISPDSSLTTPTLQCLYSVTFHLWPFFLTAVPSLTFHLSNTTHLSRDHRYDSYSIWTVWSALSLTSVLSRDHRYDSYMNSQECLITDLCTL